MNMTELENKTREELLEIATQMGVEGCKGLEETGTHRALD